MKKILLIVFAFLITGCTADYNLKIDNDYIYEDLSIAIPNYLVDDEVFNAQTSTKIPVYVNSGAKYNESTKIDDDNHFANFSYKHDISEFGKSNFMIKCFSKNDVSETDEKIIFKTGTGFNCIKMEDDAYLDEVVFSITTDLKVIKNNADNVNGKTYTWIFDDNNYEDKSIVMEIEKSLSLKNSLDKNIWLVLAMIVGFAVVGGYFGYKIFLRKMNDSNQL